jgi:hypothetical protein
MTISLLIFSPFFYNEIYNDFRDLKPELLYGVLKGIFFFEYVNTGQKLSKETASSRVFMGAVAVGIIALINVFLFSEILTFNQLLSSLLITILGIFYYFKGHLSETSVISCRSFGFIIYALVYIFDYKYTSNVSNIFVFQ